MVFHIESIIEKLLYIKSCISERDVLVFESVRLSEDNISQIFDQDDQQLLQRILDTTMSLSCFPEDSSISRKINFLNQLFMELDFFYSPSSLQSLRSGDLVEWDPNADQNDDLHLPRIYKHFGKIHYVHLLTNTSNFKLDPVITISSCCNALITILNSFNRPSIQFSPSEEILFQDILKSIFSLIVKPIVDLLCVATQNIVSKSFEQNFSPIN